MSPFLNDVRVIPLLAGHSGLGTSGFTFHTQEGSPGAKPSANTSSSEDPSPTSSRHHSSGDSSFIAIPITAIVFTFIFLIVKAIMAPFRERAKYNRSMPQGTGGGLTAEEVAVLQKLQRTLSQMESRVEALETILIDQARTEKNYGPKL